jgi:hypothetical protein
MEILYLLNSRFLLSPVLKTTILLLVSESNYFIYFILHGIVTNQLAGVFLLCLDRNHGWLTPVLLSTQEAEIRRIMVQSQPPGK